ncbi:DUF4747 family protein [Archangium gephyra]|uniref:DUF4747 family protein n=1 Tax=Archangium gephyra TaxID=48 RepID=UPI003B7EA109
MHLEKTIRIGALNIKTIPHSPETYISLFDNAQKRRTATNFRGNNYAIIGEFSLFPDSEKNNPIYFGKINCYTDFDLDRPWFDKAAGKEASEEELASIPRNLRPEFKAIEFVFFPLRHRLFFRLDLSHSSIKRIIQEILIQNKQRSDVHQIDVQIEQQSEHLENIFNLKELRKLEIVISRPNPDDTGKYDKIIKERLSKQKAAKLTTVLEAEHGQSLDPDPETRKMATLALSDGVVRGHGLDEKGRVIDKSTEKHPLTMNATFNPQEQDAFEVMREKAIKALEDIRSRIPK